jgi:metal-dependent amidase/aminoacylase/carboxypeptidase family protein
MPTDPMTWEAMMMGTVQNGLGAAVLAALALVAGARPAPAQRHELMDAVDRRLQEVRDDLVAVRRDLHRHPEVSGQEERTAAIVAARLRALGLEVRTGVGGHGVVGVLRGGGAGPVVAYRADMDAARSNAPDPVPFASETPGVRHICGHDIHTTVALGVAEGLAAVRARVPGTVVFIFQPAEENMQGARAMIADGVLRDPAPGAIFAVHTAPLEVGQIGSVEGMALPGYDQVIVRVRGTGDVEQAAGRYAQAIRGASTGGEVAPEEFVLAMTGQPRLEDGAWVVMGLVRAGSIATRARAREAILRNVAEIAQDGVSHELSYEDLLLPDMVNDSALVRSTLAAIRSAVGAEALIEVNQVTPFFSEDFAQFQQQIPGAMYWLGVSNSALGTVGMPHSPGYVADEGSIVVGSKAMAAVLLDYLATH